MGEGKTSICARVDDELVGWMDQQIEVKRFSNRTHALNYALYVLKQAETAKTPHKNRMGSKRKIKKYCSVQGWHPGPNNTLRN